MSRESRSSYRRPAPILGRGSALQTERLSADELRLSWTSGEDRAGRRANADANNRSGRGWTAMEPATARTGAEQASGIGID